MPAPRVSTTLLWGLIATLLAITVGGLFRAADDTGVALFRMFGTLGLIPVMLAATQGMRHLFAIQGRQVVWRAIEADRRALMVLDGAALGPGLPRPQFVVVGPTGVLALMIDAYEPAMTKQGRRFQQDRAIRTAAQLDEGLRRALAGQVPEAVPMRAAVLTLRRRPPVLKEAQNYLLLESSELSGQLAALRQEVPSLKPAWYEAVKAALTSA